MINPMQYSQIKHEQMQPEEGMFEDESMRTCKIEVGPEILQEFSTNTPNSETLSPRSMVFKTETSPPQNYYQKRFLDGENVAVKCEETCVTTDLMTEIKKEVDDESEITNEWIGCFNINEDDLSQETLKVVKKEDSSFFMVAPSDDYSPAFSAGSSGISFHSPCMVTNVQQYSKYIKPKDVSVKLVDLFSDSSRKNGKAHVKNGTCMCIYCRGEFKYTDEPLHVSFENDQTSPLESDLKQLGKRQRIKENICGHCLSIFSSDRSYVEHCLLVHGNERPFTCMQCRKKFKAHEHYIRHLTLHQDEGPIKCDSCPARFDSSLVLKCHIKLHHNKNIKRYSCKDCPAVFNRNDNLKRHLVVHTGEKPHVCKYCPASFKQVQSLTKHLTIHVNEGPFKCELCPSAFKLRYSLTVHAKVHSDLRPFKCELCSTTYKRRKALNKHMSTSHSVKNLYKSQQCPTTFKRSNN